MVDSNETDSYDDSSYEPEGIEEHDWSMDDDNIGYHSEDLHSPISLGDEGTSKIKTTFPQHDEYPGFDQVNLELGMEFADLESFKNVFKDDIVN